MGLFSPGGENLLDFLEVRQVLSTCDGDLRDPFWWPQERPVPMRVARGPLSIPLPSMPGPKIMCGFGAEPEDSSPMLTWILGSFWSLPRGVSPRLQWGHAPAISSRAVAAVSRFPSRGSRDLWLSLEAFTRGFPTRLSHEAFTRGFPTGLSHVPPWCESILGLKVEAVQGKQVSLNGLRHLGDSGNGATTLEFLSLFLWRGPPLEMQRERREFFPDHSGKESLHSS